MCGYMFLPLLVCILVCYGSAQESFTPYRLPGAILPERYKLRIITNFQEKDFAFDGQVWVGVRVEEDTDEITLHSAELNILETTVIVRDQESGDLLPIKKHLYDKDKDFYTIRLGKTLEKGRTYRVYIQYTGRLSSALVGYYRSSYVDKETNQTRWIASTVFEPIAARRAFPCFDEPAMKARFEISLARRANMTTISNMPLKSTEPMQSRAGWVWDHYEESVPMSTYLVAFLVSDFSSKEKISEATGKPFRTWSRQEVIEQTQYGLDIGPRILEYFSSLLNFSDPLPKQDMVALPTFVGDALENWGIISYGENYLLHQPNVSSASSKFEVALTVAHELAHQWFGNLVTPKWWTDIWLNEGFATYYSTLAVNHVHPEWNALSLSAVNSLLKVSATDALKSSHPLSVNVKRPSELYQIFDSITYFKGYYVIRMLNFSLGESTLSRGVSRYLMKYQFGNAEQDDLWDLLTEQAHTDGTLPANLTIKTIMDTWTLSTGYPVITVTRNYSDNTADVTQSRFLRPKGEMKGRSGADNSSWWVPLTFTTEVAMDFESTAPRVWLDPDEDVRTITDLAQPDEWAIFNLQAAGLYRVNYDMQNWKLIIRQLNSDRYDKIAVINRAQILDDVLDFARAGVLSYYVALDVTNYLSRETHYLPWKSALSNLGYINKMTRTTPGYGQFKRFIRDMVSPVFEEIGFGSQDGDSLLDSLNRRQMLRWACRVGHEKCVTRATEVFKEWMLQEDPDSNNTVPVNLRDVVYCTAVEHGREDEWNFLWERYVRSGVGSETNSFLAGLGCTKELWLLRRYLDWSIQKDSKIQKQDSAAVFEAVAKNPVGYFLAKDFLKNNINKIQKYIGLNPFHLSKIIEAISGGMNQPNDISELEEFEAKNKDELKAASRAVIQANERVQNNVGWMKKNYQVITDWLEEHSRSVS